MKIRFGFENMVDKKTKKNEQKSKKQRKRNEKKNEEKMKKRKTRGFYHFSEFWKVG